MSTLTERPAMTDEELKAAGLKRVEMYVIDTDAPGFAEEMRRQSRLLAEHDAKVRDNGDQEFWEAAQAEVWNEE